MKKKIQKHMTRETALFVQTIIAALCLQISLYTLCAPLLALSLVLLFTITLY